jgi:sigma-B regulation protein RsbU (phosphoserine phosphatase)
VRENQEDYSLKKLEKTGTLVGLFDDVAWEEKTISINPGEVLILYTDGISEAQNNSGQFFGNDRLEEILRESFSSSAETYRDEIFDKVQGFIGSAPRLDDITLIVLSRLNEEK